MTQEILNTEELVKQKLGIKDFRNLSKNKVVEFVSSIPNMDKEVAIKCIEQFPKFKEYSSLIVDRFYDAYRETLKSDPKDDLEAYRLILDSLKSLLEKPELTESERSFIIEEMITVANHLNLAVKDHQGFKERLMERAAILGAFAMALGGGLLGLHLRDK